MLADDRGDVGSIAAMAEGLIALDFDGTLLRSDGTVGDRTQAALELAAAAGWLIVGATGRPRALGEVVTDVVPIISHLVCLNGTQTIDLRAGAILVDHLLAHEEALDIAVRARRVIDDLGLAFDLVDGAQLWEAGFEVRVPSSPLGLHAHDALADLRDARAREVRKVLAWSDTWGTTALTKRLADELHEFGVAHAGLAFAEIGRPGVSKATALDSLARQHGVPIGRCVAFGDARNDHEMLRWAGVGVAMGNADDETTALADETTATNDGEGIARWIEHAIG